MPRSHKVSYRRCSYQGDRQEASLEADLREVLAQGPQANSYTARIFTVSDAATKAVINRHDLEPPGILAEVFQLDPRRELSFLQHAPEPGPLAQVRSRGVPLDEDHLGAPAYMVIVGNHMALVESAGLRTPQIQSYLNTLLQSGGRLDANESWKLVPKIEVDEGEIALGRGVSAIEVKPIARLVGDAPGEVERRDRRRAPAVAARREEKLARGPKVFDLLRTAGATDADLGDLRARLSNDLGLEAKLIISVRTDARGTQAKLDAADLTSAVASLEEENTVTVVSPDGKQRGRLATLSSYSEIRDEGGLLVMGDVAAVLMRALRGWSHKRLIDLQEE